MIFFIWHQKHKPKQVGLHKAKKLLHSKYLIIKDLIIERFDNMNINTKRHNNTSVQNGRNCWFSVSWFYFNEKMWMLSKSITWSSKDGICEELIPDCRTSLSKLLFYSLLAAIHQDKASFLMVSFLQFWKWRCVINVFSY